MRSFVIPKKTTAINQLSTSAIAILNKLNVSTKLERTRNREKKNCSFQSRVSIFNQLPASAVSTSKTNMTRFFLFKLYYFSQASCTTTVLFMHKTFYAARERKIKSSALNHFECYVSFVLSVERGLLFKQAANSSLRKMFSGSFSNNINLYKRT